MSPLRILEWMAVTFFGMGWLLAAVFVASVSVSMIRDAFRNREGSNESRID